MESDRGAWLGRQKVLAQFGMHALRSSDLQAILQEACALVAQGLDAPIAKALERLPDEGELLLSAAFGLPPELGKPRITRVPGGRKSAAGYALAMGKPILSHIPTETRFQPSDIVTRAGIIYSANVLIQVDNERYGAFEVDRVDERAFTDDDVTFLQTYANLLGAAVIRQRAAAQVDALLREKDLLLRELQHRVKNDLQVIMALVTLEQRQATGLEAKARLDSIRARIDSLRLVHERLFAREAVGRVELADYLRALSLSRFQMHGLDPNGAVRLALALADVAIDHDRAVPVGLIANEFLTNSLKYAFPMGSGIIRVAAERVGGDRVRVTLADNGIGIPDAAAPAGRGLGMRLIEMLSNQIGAEIDWSGKNGARLVITFPTMRPS